jgi:hypothetical protein
MYLYRAVIAAIFESVKRLATGWAARASIPGRDKIFLF